MKTVQQQLEEAYLLMRGILSEEDNKIISDILTLDELSKKTLGSYINKAAKSSNMHAAEFGKAVQRGAEIETLYTNKDREKANKRIKGIVKATNRLTKEQKETIEAVLTELEQEEV